MSDLKSLTVSGLVERLNQLQGHLETHLLEACKVVVELRLRGKSNPEWREGVFRWADQIVRGDVSPKMVLMLGDSPLMINSLKALPSAEQDRLLNGGTVTVAVLAAGNVVISEQQAIATMSPTTFSRVFFEGSVRSFADQKRLLLDRSKLKKSHRSDLPTEIRVDLQTEELIVGQVRVKAVEAVSALLKLGYRIERVKEPA